MPPETVSATDNKAVSIDLSDASIIAYEFRARDGEGPLRVVGVRRERDGEEAIFCCRAAATSDGYWAETGVWVYSQSQLEAGSVERCNLRVLERLPASPPTTLRQLISGAYAFTAVVRPDADWLWCEPGTKVFVFEWKPSNGDASHEYAAVALEPEPIFITGISVLTLESWLDERTVSVVMFLKDRDWPKVNKWG